jgi:pimeloyl-ACP methyl ester carboxylesterase
MLSVPQSMRSGPARRLLEAVFRPLVKAGMRAPRNWPPEPSRPGYDTTAMLFIVGDRDAVVDPEEVRVLAERYARTRFVVVSGAGHLRPAKADPDRYRSTVLDFLSTHLGEPEAREG